MSWLRRLQRNDSSADFPPLASPPPATASDYSIWRPDYYDDELQTRSETALPSVAEVSGTTSIRSVTVGRPSPTVEPTAIHPSYRPLPFRPDTTIDGWSADGVTLRGASIRGHQHRFDGTPREDDFAIHRLLDGRIAVLVADGVSDARQSHIGSAQAIRSAAEWLHTSLPADTSTTDWQHCYASVAWAMNEQAQRLLSLPTPDPLVTEENLATTLVCAVIETTAPGTLVAHITGVGDSSAWILADGNFFDVLRHESNSSTLTTSEVSGLPRVPYDIRATVVEITQGEILLLGTDGFGDPLGSGDGGVGNLFRILLDRPDPPSLIEFAHTLDFSREAFDDDRTLVAVWPTHHLSLQGDR